MGKRETGRSKSVVFKIILIRRSPTYTHSLAEEGRGEEGRGNKVRLEPPNMSGDDVDYNHRGDSDDEAHVNSSTSLSSNERRGRGGGREEEE